MSFIKTIFLAGLLLLLHSGSSAQLVLFTERLEPPLIQRDGIKSIRFIIKENLDWVDSNGIAQWYTTELRANFSEQGILLTPLKKAEQDMQRFYTKAGRTPIVDEQGRVSAVIDDSTRVLVNEMRGDKPYDTILVGRKFSYDEKGRLSSIRPYDTTATQAMIPYSEVIYTYGPAENAISKLSRTAVKLKLSPKRDTVIWEENRVSLNEFTAEEILLEKYILGYIWTLKNESVGRYDEFVCKAEWGSREIASGIAGKKKWVFSIMGPDDVYVESFYDEQGRIKELKMFLPFYNARYGNSYFSENDETKFYRYTFSYQEDLPVEQHVYVNKKVRPVLIKNHRIAGTEEMFAHLENVKTWEELTEIKYQYEFYRK
jgi:hypothetical protein